MKVLVIGATGPTGRLVLERAQRAGDSVTALVRRPEALADLSSQITVLEGDPTAPADLATAMIGQDVVISTLGRGRSMGPTDLFSRAAAALVSAAEQTGTTRVVWLSSFGAGDTYPSSTPVQKIMYSTFLRAVYADKTASERLLRASDLDLTLVYPTTLTHKPGKGTYRSGEHVPMKGAPTISREDVAHFLHSAAAGPEWIRRDAIITD